MKSREIKILYSPESEAGGLYRYLINLIKWLGDYIRRNPEMDADGALSEVRKSLIKKAAGVATRDFERDSGDSQFSTKEHRLAA